MVSLEAFLVRERSSQIKPSTFDDLRGSVGPEFFRIMKKESGDRQEGSVETLFS